MDLSLRRALHEFNGVQFFSQRFSLFRCNRLQTALCQIMYLFRVVTLVSSRPDNQERRARAVTSYLWNPLHTYRTLSLFYYVNRTNVHEK